MTEPEAVKAKVEEAREAFTYRDDRIADMTDEVRDARAVRAVYHRRIVGSIS
jgi:CO dehydrogenase/acetyl-CoA synthase beta subunit